MSSRALRKLYSDPAVAEIEEDEVEETDEPQFVSCSNKFLMLADEGDENSDTEVKSEDTEQQPAPSSQSSSKNRKKRKKKKKNSNKLEKRPNDDFEQTLKQFNKESESCNFNKTFPVKSKSLLKVEHRFLNPYNELQKIFGSHVLRNDSEYRNRNKASSSTKGMWLTQKTFSWTGKVGLSMELTNTENELMFFKYTHNKDYQKLQFDFLDIVNSSGQNDGLFKMVQEKQFHVDSLLVFSDFCRMNEQVKHAREYLEKALFFLERSFHPRFSLTTGNCRLQYKYQENRTIFLCLFKLIDYVSRRSCNRTALELTKLLYSLDPENDPLACLLFMDTYAMNCGEYEFVTKSVNDWGLIKNLNQLPNWAYSQALSEFQISLKNKDENTETADEILQDALIRFPSVLLALLEKCSVQPSSDVANHKFFTQKASESHGLQLLSHLFVERSFLIWKDSLIIEWLQRNVEKVLKIIDQNEDCRLDKYQNMRKSNYQKAPLNIYRHALISEVTGVSEYIPIEIRSITLLSFDPLPPLDTVTSYTKPDKPNPAASNTIELFLDSLAPTFDISHYVGLRRRFHTILQQHFERFNLADEEEVAFDEDWD